MVCLWWTVCLTTAFAQDLFLAPAASPPALTGRTDNYDVTHFETILLPKWLAQYKLPGSVGNYSYDQHHPRPHPYAAPDVLHVLCFTDQLELSESEKDAYADIINGFQRPDGFYLNGNEPCTDLLGCEKPGGSLWHAAGYITAGLSIIGRSPKLPNLMFDKIAITPSLWEPTLHTLLNCDSLPVPFPPLYNITSGTKDAYGCAQNIASLVSWQIQTNMTFGGMTKFKPFVDFYISYLNKHVDKATGLWCATEQVKKHGVIHCIGGSFHIDFVYQFLALHPQYKFAAPFPDPAQQLNQSLRLQKKSGGWTNDGMAYLNLDGIYQATRPSLQIGKLHWDEIEAACHKLMGLVVPALNNESRLLGPISRNTHQLPALVGAVAECQKHFPSMIKSTRPWRMCLDDVPYI